MVDLAHWWGNDLSLDATGDLAVSQGLDEDNQHIFRRLCTNGGQTGGQVAEYIWEPSYGGSAPWYVGRTTSWLALTGIIRSQMYEESSVSHSPEPKISVTVNPDGTYQAIIQYTNSNIGELVQALQLNVTG